MEKSESETQFMKIRFSTKKVGEFDELIRLISDKSHIWKESKTELSAIFEICNLKIHSNMNHTYVRSLLSCSEIVVNKVLVS